LIFHCNHCDANPAFITIHDSTAAASSGSSGSLNAKFTFKGKSPFLYAFYVDKLILKRIVRVRCCETERRDATSYDARWTSRLVMCTCLALNSTTVNMPPDRYVGRPYALLTQTYIFYARCRTSYSRWIISCSHR